MDSIKDPTGLGRRMADFEPRKAEGVAPRKRTALDDRRLAAMKKLVASELKNIRDNAKPAEVAAVAVAGQNAHTRLK